MQSKRSVWMLVVLLGLLVLAGCGDDDDDAPAGNGGSQESAAPTKVKAAALPISNFAPLWVAIDQGYFKKRNLEVEPVIVPSGPSVPPLLLNDSVQFGSMDAVSFLNAASRGLPLRMAAPASIGPDADAAPNAAVVVPAPSPIRSAQDLEGKAVAVNALKALGDLTIRASMENNGADPSTIKFVELPFPDMLGALQAGRVDAIWLTEPFLTAAKQGGARIVFESFVETRPNLPTAEWVTTQKFAEEDPDAVERFAAAIVEAQQYATENPEAVRKAVGEFSEIPPPLVKAMGLPTLSTVADADREGLELFVELGQKYGVIAGDVDLDQVILPSAGGGQ